MRSALTLVVTGLLLVAGCSSAPAPDSPAPSATTAAAPTSLGSAQERAQALAAVPAALTKVTGAQRQAACSSYTSGKDAFLSAFESRFDARYAAITPDELTTVRGTLDQVCGG
ncbi:hypothetical protein RHODO2019_05780 [Rhodococcus antarcticus]|jgi:uncharacterized protein YceK|uniref:Uncharacterized protein n=1 Tax=Rhodococcus antarcticus TaxID=2987751 RepID=A0ABY6P2R9_9NOCA|nr:hypothetical protein [Rhodococcus antarcticus]UZJ25942.1 hypothetical protein RHODO2019_05780 [Rhodococcus antarcticus]